MPHYVLFSQVSRGDGTGEWRFSLRTAEGQKFLEVNDIEPKVRGERLELLTVVRGLEALDQPSRVTLVGCSPSITRGMQYGLAHWRENGWRWEFFGHMVPVKNGDLWQRVDRALRFHQVECRQRRFDCAHRSTGNPHFDPAEKRIDRSTSATRRDAQGTDPSRPVRRHNRVWVLLRLCRRRVHWLWRCGKNLARRSVCVLVWD